MSPIDKLCESLKEKFPDAEILTRKADAEDGFQFLNLRVNGLEVAVEWKPGEDFGLSSFDHESHEFDGLFSRPDEWYASVESTFHRIASLVLDQRGTRSAEANIPHIRHERGISQEALSENLNVGQAAYSKLERRSDMKVSSLKKVIEAMGGRLKIEAIFPDTRDVRELTFQ